MGVVAEEVASGKRKLEEHLPTLRFVAQRYPAAWLLLADLHEEAGSPDGLRDAKEAVRKFLEEASGGDALAAWKRLAELCRRSGDSSGEIHALVEMSEKAEIPFDEISSAANRFNSMLIFAKSSPYGSGRPFDSEEKAVLAQRLVSVMERRISEAQATDLSRLAWLCLHLKDEPRAKQHVERGLAIDRGNEHLNRLAERLSRGGDA